MRLLSTFIIVILLTSCAKPYLTNDKEYFRRQGYGEKHGMRLYKMSEDSPLLDYYDILEAKREQDQALNSLIREFITKAIEDSRELRLDAGRLDKAEFDKRLKKIDAKRDFLHEILGVID